jgi:hypothetical protein
LFGGKNGIAAGNKYFIVLSVVGEIKAVLNVQYVEIGRAQNFALL